jgi:hypothetical protein
LQKNYTIYENFFRGIVFRYDVFETQEESVKEEYKLKSEEIVSEFVNNKLKLKIKPMQINEKNINALYSIRVIPQDNEHEEEILDSISLYSFKK